jgi:hypothetical protein
VIRSGRHNDISKKAAPVKKKVIYKQSLTIKVLVSVILTIITIVLFHISKNNKNTKILFYSEKSNLDYKVYLEKNNYYEEPYLTKNMHYIASLIDYIDINFDYNFKINDNVNSEYKYYIEAVIAIFEEGKPSNIIFEKKERLTQDIVKNIENSKSFNINETLQIDYNKYNSLAKNFKSEYNILADSNLKLVLHVEINGNYEEIAYPIKTKSSMEMIIPLTEQMIDINMDYNEINKSNEFKVTSKKGIEYAFVAISVLFGLMAFASIVQLAAEIYKVKNKKSLYQKKVEKILRNYDRVVVEIKNMIKIKENDDIIEVTSFEELLDVSDRLSKSILFIETAENEKSWFIVKNGEEIYRYILEEKSLVMGRNKWEYS